MTDWRLQGQERFLRRAHLVRKSYAAPSAKWDHDHCEFCTAKFSAAPEDLRVGYATANDEHWICPECFRDFLDLFEWTVAHKSGKTGV